MNWNISHQILSRLILYLYTLSICQQLSRLSLLLFFQNLMRNIWWIRCECEWNKTLLCCFSSFILFFSLQTFYSQVSSPLLRSITIHFPESAVNNVTQNRFDKFFSGSELIVAGKLQPSDLTTLQSFTTAAAVSPLTPLALFRFENSLFMPLITVVLLF